MATDSRPAFTLRFRQPETHRALRVAADELGISMSELAERAIERELAVVGVELEQRLEATVRLLRPYRREELEAAIENFARAEVELEDPLQARRVPAGRLDPLGIRAAFGDPVGR